MNNCLVDDRIMDLLIHDVYSIETLCRLPHFADHDQQSFQLYLESLRRYARNTLFGTYRSMDSSPPTWEKNGIAVHPDMHRIYPQLLELGITAATRPTAVGGHQLPLMLATAANAYLMAANASACGFFGLTAGAAHLIEVFGDAELRGMFLEPLYTGRWTGTMALTESSAGSSLADLSTRAIPEADAGAGGRFRIVGSKVFISGGDHDLTENIVHLTLARIAGAPPGSKGISLFAIPKRRQERGALVDNDVTVAGLIHKIGWRGLPSLALSFGERNDCFGWLVGEPHQGLAQMFQMMNEARILVGLNAAATASAAYHEALDYARTRTQGRPFGVKDVSCPQVPLIEHPDVRRMLLRQKSIVEGSLALLIGTARYADVASHGEDEAQRRRAKNLLDLLTPIAKNFPAEWGFEATTLALQVHGGYGYTCEYLPESWLRDQKLNSIQEGTTGIQGLDLLGRRVFADGGAPLRALREEVTFAVEAAERAGLDADWGPSVLSALDQTIALTLELGARGRRGDLDGMLLHSHDYLTLLSIVVIAWKHLQLATAARCRRQPDAWLSGVVESARYWIATELPRVGHLLALCRAPELSYGTMTPAHF